MSDYDPSKDPRSSNALIQAYLASKGLQPTGENVRRALEGNNANPGMIKGLMNSLPSTEAEDQAAMAARGAGGRGLPTPPIPPGANRELPDSAGGSETRVGGTGAGGGSPATSALPSASTIGGGGGGGGAPTGDELSNAMIAAAIGGGTGAGAYGLRQLWQNRSPSTAPVADAAPAVAAPGPRITPTVDASGQGSLPLEGGSGVAPPKQLELPLQGGGPRVNQPELPLTGGGGPSQGDLFTRPTTLPPSVPATPSPAPPEAVVDPELTRRLNAGTPVPGPTAEQIKANPATANIPEEEVAAVGKRAPRVRVRAPRVKIPL